MERTPVKLTGMYKFSAFMLPSCVHCQPKPFVVLILGSQQENTHTPFVHQIQKEIQINSLQDIRDKMSEMVDNSADLRNALMSLAIRKKVDKIQKKLTSQVNAALTGWEKVLHEYINMVTQLNTLLRLAEQQKVISDIRRTLKDCSEMVKNGHEQFKQVGQLIETLVPISTMNKNWLDSIIKHNENLAEVKEQLAPLMMVSTNRDVIEMVQKMLQQINDIQSKMNVLSTKVVETVDNGIKLGSDQFENLDIMENEDEDDNENENDIDTTLNNTSTTK